MEFLSGLVPRCCALLCEEFLLPQVSCFEAVLKAGHPRLCNDIYSQPKVPQLAFALCCQYSSDDVVHEMLLSGRVDPEAIQRGINRASLCGKFQLVCFLSERHGAECTMGTFLKACKSGNLEVIRYVFEKRNYCLPTELVFNQKPPNGKRCDNRAVAEALRSLVHTVLQGLKRAYARGHPEAIEWLENEHRSLKKLCPSSLRIKKRIFDPVWRLQAAMFGAYQNGDPNVIEVLSAQCSELVPSKILECKTCALFGACRGGHQKLIADLLNEGIVVTSALDNVALHWAGKSKDRETIELVLWCLETGDSEWRTHSKTVYGATVFGVAHPDLWDRAFNSFPLLRSEFLSAAFVYAIKAGNLQASRFILLKMDYLRPQELIQISHELAVFYGATDIAELLRLTQQKRRKFA